MRGKWEDKEIELLKNNYLNLGNIELSKLLDRTVKSVSSELSVRGLHRPKEWNCQRMKNNNPMKNPEIAKKMWETHKGKYPNWRSRNVGRKNLATTMRNIVNNPMFNQQTVEKMRQKKLGKTKENCEYIKRMSETKKMQFREGLRIHPKGFLGKHHTKESKMKISKLVTGEGNPFYGKKHTEETKNILRKKSKEYGLNLVKTPNNKKEWLKKMMGGIKKPTRPERILIQIIKDNNLPFNYVGNGQVWFKGQNTVFNPDFLSKNPKHIIEVFGNYWHSLPKFKKNDAERLKTYKKYGYKTLVIWENELIKNKKPLDDFAIITNKIKQFIGG